MTSLRLRLGAGLVLLLALLFTGGGAALHALTRARLLAAVDAELESLARSLAWMAEDEGDGLSFEPDEDAAGDALLPPGAHFAILLPDGSRWRSSPGPPPAEPRRTVRLDLPPRRDPDAPGPFLEGRPLTVVVSRSVAGEGRFLANLRQGLFLAGLGTLAAAALLVALAVRRGLAPLERLSAGVAAVGAAELGRRFDTDLPRELQPIARALNELLARLEEAFARERRFNAAVAHELRTPLAELRAVLEVTERTGGGEAEVRTALADALDAAGRLERLATGLLALRRFETGEALPPSGTVRLAEVLQQAWQAQAAAARWRGLRLELDGEGPAACRCLPELAEVVVQALVENAIQHAPEGTTVRGSVAAADGRVRLRLCNPAPGLEPADLSRLFEAFWRKDAARSSPDNLGLGLHLAATAARAAGLELEATLEDGDRLCFELAGPEA